MLRLTRGRRAFVVAALIVSITGLPHLALPAPTVPVPTPVPTPSPVIDPVADLALAKGTLVVKGDLPVFKFRDQDKLVKNYHPKSWGPGNDTTAPAVFNDARDAEMKRCLGFEDTSITTAQANGARFAADTDVAVESFAMTARTTELARQVATERARGLGSCLAKVHTTTFREDAQRELQRLVLRLSKISGVRLTLTDLDVVSQTSEIPVDNLEAHASVRVGFVSKLTARVVGPAATPTPDPTQARLLAINRGPTHGKGGLGLFFDIVVMQANRSVVAIVFFSAEGTNLDIERFVMASVGLHLTGVPTPG